MLIYIYTMYVMGGLMYCVSIDKPMPVILVLCNAKHQLSRNDKNICVLYVCLYIYLYVVQRVMKIGRNRS